MAGWHLPCCSAHHSHVDTAPLAVLTPLCFLLQALQTSGLASGRIFLAAIEFKDSKPLFHRLGVNTLPWIMHISPSQSVGSDGVVSVKPGEVVGAAPLNAPLSLCTCT